MKKRSAKRCIAYACAFALAATLLTDVSYKPLAADTSRAAAENESAIDAAEGELAALEQKQAELDEQINAAADNISDQQEKQKAISEQIDTVETTLHKLADSIEELEAQIAQTSEDIEQTQQQADGKKTEIMDGIDSYKKRLRAMYIAGNESYTDILVGASDFYDMLMKLELVKRVAGHDARAIDELVEMKTEYEAQLAELDEQKRELDERSAELEERRVKQQAQMVKLEELYSQSEENIQSLETDKETYEKNLAQVQAEQEQFEADLQKLYEEQEKIKKQQEAERKKKEEEEKRRKEEEEERRKQEELANSSSQTDETAQTDNDSGSDTSSETEQPSYTENTTPNSGGTDPNAKYGYVPKSRFTWPVPGFYHISYGVGWRWGAYHKGIDIYSPNIRGANIVAADSGTVIVASNTCPHDYGKNYSCGCGGGYGNYCIIDHGDGYWTLYGHSEHISVSVGQYVEKGTVLGTVGSTGYSTGPHTHFEVRIGGTAVDPTGYV